MECHAKDDGELGSLLLQSLRPVAWSSCLRLLQALLLKHEAQFVQVLQTPRHLIHVPTCLALHLKKRATKAQPDLLCFWGICGLKCTAGELCHAWLDARRREFFCQKLHYS